MTKLDAAADSASNGPHPQSLAASSLPDDVPPPAHFRKRQLGSGDDSALHHPKRTRLTQENLNRFNKTVRRKSSHNPSLVGPGPPQTTAESVITAMTTSTTSAEFTMRAVKNGIICPPGSKRPGNLEDIRMRLDRCRETPSPTPSVYQDYVETVEEAVNEETMVHEVGQMLLKRYPATEGYKRAFNQPFTAFPKDVGFNKGLPVPQPVFAEGVRTKDYLPFPIDEHIPGTVLYSDDPGSLTLPHLAGELRGSGADMKEVRLLSAYHGAALVYSRNRALSHIGKSDRPGHSEITTFTTDGTILNFFAHYATQSESGTSEYHQYPIVISNLTSSYEEFKQGWKRLRNQQDYARRLSLGMKKRLKRQWQHPAAGGVGDDGDSNEHVRSTAAVGGSPHLAPVEVATKTDDSEQGCNHYLEHDLSDDPSASTICMSLCKPVRLDTISDWEAWDNAFQQMAIGNNIWEYIRPGNCRPWPKNPQKPRKPRVSDHEYGVLDDSREGYFVAEQQAAYNEALSCWKVKQSEHIAVMKSMQKTRKWIEETLSQKLFRKHCKPPDSITTWYRNLRMASKPYTQHLNGQARAQYLKLIAKPLKIMNEEKFMAWVSKWESVIQKARRRKVPEAMSAISWTAHIRKCLRDLLPYSIPALLDTHCSAVIANTITPEELAQELRSVGLRGLPNKKPQKPQKTPVGGVRGPS